MKHSPPPIARTATLALVVACLFWGCGFTWSKEGEEAFNNAAGLPSSHPLGPIWFLAVRFFFAGIAWLIVFPTSRRGWTRSGIIRGTILGTLLGLAMVVQHVALVRTTEAVCAFLTSLSVLFVPLISMLQGKRPRLHLWGGIVMAILGIWLMTGAQPRGFGLGEWLSLACALCFSLYFIGVNAIVPRDDPYRMTAATFLVSALACAAITLSLPGQSPEHLCRLLATPKVPQTMALCTLLPTIISFGLVAFFQPRVEPTRAVIIYLTEPVFAALFACIMRQRMLSPLAITGALLILAANAATELIEIRRAAAGPATVPPTAPLPEIS